jgi:preprotein translocase subunit SecB
MVESNRVSGAGAGAGGAAGAGEYKFQFYIHGQFTKDLSFENPNALRVAQMENPEQSSVSVGVETKVASLSGGFYEVDMRIDVKSVLREMQMFVIDLTYAAVVNIVEGVEANMVESILLVHVPFLMFPFARNIVADTARGGGYPAVLIEPVDFATLYVQKKTGGGVKEDQVMN